MLYYQIAEFLPVIAEVIGAATFGIGELLGAGLQMALLNWRRMSEYTADRAGLLGVSGREGRDQRDDEDRGPAAEMLCRRSNVEDFIAQAREFTAMDGEKLNWFAKWLSAVGQSPSVDGHARQRVPGMDRQRRRTRKCWPRRIRVRLPRLRRPRFLHAVRPLTGRAGEILSRLRDAGREAGGGRRSAARAPAAMTDGDGRRRGAAAPPLRIRVAVAKPGDAPPFDAESSGTLWPAR